MTKVTAVRVNFINTSTEYTSNSGDTITTLFIKELLTGVALSRFNWVPTPNVPRASHPHPHLHPPAPESAIQQVFDMTFYDSISICLQLLASVPHNHLLPTSASSFFLLEVFSSIIPRG